jgi:hypothetical protein
MPLTKGEIEIKVSCFTISHWTHFHWFCRLSNPLGNLLIIWVPIQLLVPINLSLPTFLILNNTCPRPPTPFPPTSSELESHSELKSWKSSPIGLLLPVAGGADWGWGGNKSGEAIPVEEEIGGENSSPVEL